MGQSTASDARRYLVTGRHVGLSPIRPDDERPLFDLWRDPDVQRNLNCRDAEPTFEEWQRERDDPTGPTTWFECVIASLTDGAFVGYGSLGRATSRPELMVLLCADRRGRGYGTEAAGLLLDYGFGCLGLDCIGGGAMEFNLASQTMLGKAGFVRTPESDGKYRNAWGEGCVVEFDYVLDRTRWESLRTGRSS